MALDPKSKRARMVASGLPMATLSRVTGASSSSALREELYRPGGVETVYGPVVETVSIGGVEVEYLNPFALLRHASEVAPQFGEFLAGHLSG